MIVELHSHSIYSSDGHASVEQILGRAKNIGLGAIAITDHNQIQGSRKAVALAKKYNIIVIPGIEIDCKDEKGQVLAYGTNEMISGNILDVIDKIHSLGGIAVAAHPSGGLGSPAFQNKEVIKKMDAIEVFNGLAFSWQNKKSAKLARQLKKPGTSGSDAHTLEELGTAACKINANSAERIIRAIKKGQVILPKKKTSTLSVITSKIKRRF